MKLRWPTFLRNDEGKTKVVAARFFRGRRARLVAAAAAVLVAAGAGTAFAVDRLFGLPDNAAFQVDDEVVTEEQLQQRVQVLKALYGVRIPAGGTELEQFNRTAAKAMAVSMILDDAAAERGIVIGDKSARDTLSTMIDRQLRGGGRAEFVQLLGQYGASEQNVIEEIKRQQRVHLLFQKVIEGAVDSVGDRDVRRHFEQNRDSMVTPERRRLNNIVARDRAEAVELLRQARSGTRLSLLAERYSIDDSTSAQGGSLGLVARNQLDPAYAKVAFAAKQGSVYGPVRTSHGWNIGQVVDVVPPRELGFAAVEQSIRGSMRSEAALRAWRAWLAEQIEHADVEYADEYLPAAPDAPPPGPSSVPGLNIDSQSSTAGESGGSMEKRPR